MANLTAERPTARDVAGLLVAAALTTGAFWTFEVPAIVRRGLAGVEPATVSTVVLLVGLAVACTFWTTSRALPRPSSAGVLAATLAGAAALLVVGLTISRWISTIVLFGIDPNRADMLVQIGAAVERFASGQNPYVIYQVPWQLPLSYGPWLWMWYLVPYWLHADLRFVTIFGEAFVGALLAVAAVTAARGTRYLAAGVLGFAAIVVLHNPLFDRFLTIGHTPAYWPLIAAFALLVAGGRWRAAAVLLAVLVGARTTMIALVPTFAIVVWRSDRRSFLPAVVLFATTLAVSFGPFLLLDWRMLVYGMYGNYVRVIHDFVWTQTDWMRSTIGLTRVLVASGRSQYVGPAQVVVMAIVYALTWWRLRPGVAPAPWFCLALAAFCMTTLWPVWYVFLDVFVLASCFLAADHVPELPRAPWKTIGATALLTTVALLGTLVVNPGVYYDIEAGKTPRWHFRSGFGPDLEEGGRVFAWATRDRVHLRVPRGFATRAAIEIECDPFSPPGAPAQTLGASLNGSALGQVSLRRGWQTVRFESSARAWRIGHNDLTLFFRYALPAGEGEVRAVRISRVSIVR